MGAFKSMMPGRTMVSARASSATAPVLQERERLFIAKDLLGTGPDAQGVEVPGALAERGSGVHGEAGKGLEQSLVLPQQVHLGIGKEAKHRVDSTGVHDGEARIHEDSYLKLLRLLRPLEPWSFSEQAEPSRTSGARVRCLP